MNITRQKDNYGGGSGREFFKSKLFRVVHWIHGNGKESTTLELKLRNCSSDIRFDGWINLDKDNLCMEQLTTKEILSMFEYHKENAYHEGQKDKALEFRNCLGVK